MGRTGTPQDIPLDSHHPSSRLRYRLTSQCGRCDAKIQSGDPCDQGVQSILSLPHKLVGILINSDEVVLVDSGRRGLAGIDGHVVVDLVVDSIHHS